MNIVTSNTIVIEKNVWCPNCNEGLLIGNITLINFNDDTYSHQCSNCDHIEYLEDLYPLFIKANTGQRLIVKEK